MVPLDSKAKGRTIRIFLADGAPSGILTAEILNWTGKAISTPRARLADFLQRKECRRPGLYFLTGPDPDKIGGTIAYIGESDNAADRIVQHSQDDSKDFWNRATVLISKDENMTKAHIRYLESRVVTLAKQANRSRLLNGNSPPTGNLPESDISDMEFFIEQIQVVMPLLGFDLLKAPIASETFNSLQAPTFKYSAINVSATAIEVDGVFIVKAGSTARAGVGTPSWTSYKQLRNQLISEGKLVLTDDTSILKFNVDVEFSSPSAAAAVIFAGNQNGRTQWRLSDTGVTYKEWQQAQLNKSL